MPDLTLVAFIGSAIVGVVEGIKRLIPSVNGYVTVVIAGILGLLSGFAGIAGVNWFWGLIAGLAAAGGVTIATKIGGK